MGARMGTPSVLLQLTVPFCLFLPGRKKGLYLHCRAVRDQLMIEEDFKDGKSAAIQLVNTRWLKLHPQLTKAIKHLDFHIFIHFGTGSVCALNHA